MWQTDKYGYNSDERFSTLQVLLAETLDVPRENVVSRMENVYCEWYYIIKISRGKYSQTFTVLERALTTEPLLKTLEQIVTDFNKEYNLWVECEGKEWLVKIKKSIENK